MSGRSVFIVDFEKVYIPRERHWIFFIMDKCLFKIKEVTTVVSGSLILILNMCLYARIWCFLKGYKSVQRWQNRFPYNSRRCFFGILFVNFKLLFFLEILISENYLKCIDIIFVTSSPKENVMFEILMKQIRPDMKLLLKVRLSLCFSLTYWYMNVF